MSRKNADTKELPKIDLSKIGKSKRLARQNSEYLELESVIEKSKIGLTAEQAMMTSKPAQESTKQLLRQLDLMSHMVRLPHLLLIMAQAYWHGLFAVIDRLSGKPNIEGMGRKAFEKSYKTAMQHFFAVDTTGQMSRSLVFAITVYAWTALECYQLICGNWR